MSPAPYAHQWHTKPKILGLNLSPALMISPLSNTKPGFKDLPAGRGFEGFGLKFVTSFSLEPLAPGPLES
jgi:hypothetical protein